MEAKKNRRTNLLDTHIPKDVSRYIDFSIMISEMILQKLDELGINKREFARSLGKKESQISEWLSGMHSFTLKTLAEISLKYDLDFSEAFRLTLSKSKEKKQHAIAQKTDQIQIHL